MKHFFEEHTSSIIICIMISLLLCTIGNIKSINNDNIVSGNGFMTIIGNNILKTLNTNHKHVVPNKNLLGKDATFSSENNYTWFNKKESIFSSEEVSGRMWATQVLNKKEVHKVFKPNTTYTLSYDYELTDICARDLPDYDIKIGFILWDQDQEIDAITGSGKTINLYIRNFKDKNIKKHFSRTFKTPSILPENYYFLSYSNRYADENGNYDLDTAKFTNIKLEEGSEETRYID